MEIFIVAVGEYEDEKPLGWVSTEDEAKSFVAAYNEPLERAQKNNPDEPYYHWPSEAIYYSVPPLPDNIPFLKRVEQDSRWKHVVNV